MIKSFISKTKNRDQHQLTLAGRLWRSFRELLPSEQGYRMALAYDRVFRSGGAEHDDMDMVLLDLAQKSGFYRNQKPRGDQELLYELGVEKGKREMFGHIFNQLRLSPQEIADLEAGVRTDYLRLSSSQNEDLRRQYLS